MVYVCRLFLLCALTLAATLPATLAAEACDAEDASCSHNHGTTAKISAAPHRALLQVTGLHQSKIGITRLSYSGATGLTMLEEEDGQDEYVKICATDDDGNSDEESSDNGTVQIDSCGNATLTQMDGTIIGSSTLCSDLSVESGHCFLSPASHWLERVNSHSMVKLNLASLPSPDNAGEMQLAIVHVPEVDSAGAVFLESAIDEFVAASTNKQHVILVGAGAQVANMNGKYGKGWLSVAVTGVKIGWQAYSWYNSGSRRRTRRRRRRR